MTIAPLSILASVYPPPSATYTLLVHHGRQVAGKALALAGRLADERIDRGFVREAALLHDIGIGLTAAPSLGCHGPHPYVCHGYLGRKLLDGLALPRHALVCERHVGAGLAAVEIRRRGLPLPERDMLPLSLEEQLICYADKFFSKTGPQVHREHSLDDVLRSLAPFGREQLDRFRQWARRFGDAR
jgi:uncharacterized protein